MERLILIRLKFDFGSNISQDSSFANIQLCSSWFGITVCVYLKHIFFVPIKLCVCALSYEAKYVIWRRLFAKTISAVFFYSLTSKSFSLSVFLLLLLYFYLLLVELCSVVVLIPKGNKENLVFTLKIYRTPTDTYTHTNHCVCTNFFRLYVYFKVNGVRIATIRTIASRQNTKIISNQQSVLK